MSTPNLPSDYFLHRYQFTETNHRDVYPALQAVIADSQVGKTVLITGASQGIGRGIALAFAKAGATGLVLAARNVQKLEETKAEILKINSKAKVVVVSVDTTSQEAVSVLEQAAKDAFGHVDILVNNAGVGGRGLIKDIDVNKWWSDMEVNVKGTFLVTRAYLRLLPADKRGFIGNVGSYAAEMVVPSASSYIVSKLAVHRFTELVASEHPNVQVVAFHPGSVMTSIVADMRDFAHFAQDKVGLPGDFAVYVCSERAAYLNGRYASCNWDVRELEAKKDEIISKDLLKERLAGVYSTV